MKRDIAFIVAILVICFAYIQIMNFADTHENKGGKPSIQVSEQVLELSVKDSEKTLLEGVSATDKEDGDISSNVIVESISPFDENMQRTINYAVFDSDGNVSRMIRPLRYTDYSAPVISIKKGLVLYTFFEEIALLDYVSAKSSLDGDISSSIRIENMKYNDYNATVVFSVSDSTGTYQEKEFSVTLVNKPITNTIELETYHVSIPVGIAYFNPRDYIRSITGPLGNLNGKKNEVTINDNVDYDTPGTYEIMYTINTDDGNFGATKLLVTVY